MKLPFRKAALLFFIANSINSCCCAAYDNYRQTGLSLKQLETIAQWETAMDKQLSATLEVLVLLQPADTPERADARSIIEKNLRKLQAHAHKTAKHLNVLLADRFEHILPEKADAHIIAAGKKPTLKKVRRLAGEGQISRATRLSLNAGQQLNSNTLHQKGLELLQLQQDSRQGYSRRANRRPHPYKN